MKVIREGSTGASVRYCQERLATHGFDPGSADGSFGPNTERAVVQFQQAHGLVDDGIVGPATWAILTTGERPQTPEDALAEQRAELTGAAGVDGSHTGSQSIAEAVKFLGAREQPDGSNLGPDIAPLITGYRDYWSIGGSGGLAWCAMAVSVWSGMALGLGDDSEDMDWERHPFGAFYGGCSQILAWAKKNDAWHPRDTDYTPQPGDAFLMPRAGSDSDPSASTKSSHTGLVVCDNGDGTITTIEGNTSNRVASLRRKRSSVLGFVRWAT